MTSGTLIGLLVLVLAAIGVVELNLADRRRRSRLTKAEREAEDSYHEPW